MATEIKELSASKGEKTTTEIYYNIMKEAIGKDILDFTDEEELYNAVMTAKRKDCVNVPKYITQSFLNMCILLRESKGLTTDILKKNKIKQTKEQKAKNNLLRKNQNI